MSFKHTYVSDSMQFFGQFFSKRFLKHFNLLSL